MQETEEDDRLRQLREALDSEPNNHSHHYDLGHLLWQRAEKEGSRELKEGAVEHFVVAAKLNPNNGAAFRYLGHYYSRVSLDPQRASKCYQRAVSLNPDDFEAGEALCELLDGARKESLEVSVCREASERSSRAFWAFRRLGYLQVHQKKWSEGVQSLQHAIRGYPACADLWEALGLAYQRLGMYTAAVKSYARAVELEDSKVFALVESGNIHMMLGSFRKGIDQFRSAMEIAPCNVSAHFGLASALLGLSKDYVNSGAFSWGASLLEEASEVAKACTSLAGNFYSSWKLYGDVQIAYAKCFPWAEKNDGEINEEIFKTTFNSWKRTRLLAAICANRSYQRALHLTPWQANIYSDIAISSDLIHTYEERKCSDLDVWRLPEKMCLGGLMLEGKNNEFWVVLGCLSNNDALKQHAFIRGLQLDVSLSIAWAYLGKLYRKLGEKKLAKQAFDRARSIDPSLALPWAGMSADTPAGDLPLEEAYDSCLRAVQIMPLAEFQVGLGILGALSCNLLSPQVFGAVRQAVQHAPFYPESHNLNGLVCEVRSDYPSAISAYRLARYTFNLVSVSAAKSHLSDVSFNLARSLCKAGHVLDAAQECEDLKKEGLLDNKGLQIYAVALCQLGKTDQALTEARHLGVNISTMDPASRAAALGLICKLIYHISGQEPAAATILKIPNQLLQSSKMRFIVSAISAFDPSSQLQSLHPNSLGTLASHEELTEMHSLIAISKMIADGSKENIGVQTAVDHLRKALHTYPDSCLIRNQLSSLLLSSKDWMASHTATKCIVIPTKERSTKGLKSPYEIIGSAAVACYATCTTKPRFSFPTCGGKFIPGTHQGIYQVQKWLHQEPWNNKARYLLILIVLQKAREEKFPQYLRVTFKRLVQAALSEEIYLENAQNIQYQKFQLLLCSSEISLQCGDYFGCINHATDALRILTPSNCRFFAHLQLCRAYAALEDWQNLNSEFMNCLRHKTDYQIGWISLKYLESRYKLQNVGEPIDLNFGADSIVKRSSQSMWVAIFDLACCQNFIWDQDFVNAEKALRHAQSMGNLDRCLLLCHGAICMELARQRSGSQFLSLAASSLTKAQENSPAPLPLVSALLAQAEASLGARTQWEKNLRYEWFSWPAEIRPAELFFQMHLLAKQPSAGSNRYAGIESCQSPERWILRAIHLNPSCLRYWKVLHKLMEP